MNQIKNKFCRICSIDLDEDNTRKSDIKQSNYVCKSCAQSIDKLKYYNKKEIIREQQRLYDLNLKNTVIEAYGNKCSCCGESAKEFLNVTCHPTVKNQKSGGELYRWIIGLGFPKDECLIFCHNCNTSIQLFGYCPHKKD